MSTKGYNGRNLIIKLDGSKVAAVQTRSVARNRSEVDVTNDDSSGWRTLLADPATRSIDVSISGVATVNNYNDLITRWYNTGALQNVTIEHPDGTEEAATDGFFIGSLQHEGEHDGHVSFSAELMSSGVVSKTDPAP